MGTKSIILIADDSPSALLRMEEVLKTEGYDLVMVDNGRDAFEQAKRLNPDLMLLDVVMPHMDGFEVCQAVRGEPGLAEVPVILITSLSDRDSRLEGLTAGADDFLSKPFDDAELLARVQTITRLNRYRRLHMERTRFQWVVDQAEEGYLLLDSKDSILYANQKAKDYLQITGLEKDVTFLAQARRQFRFEPEMAWAVWPAVPFTNPRPVLTLVRPETHNASTLWLEVNVLEQPGAGTDERLIRLREITDEISTRRDVWTFQSMVSHKLRTPLSGMLFGLQVLSADPHSFSPEEIQDMATMAYDNTQRLSDEIDDILEYLESPVLAAPGEGFDLIYLDSMLDRIVEELEMRKPRITGFENLETTRINLSRNALELVLWEVLENSLKFHPKNDPEVSVEVSTWGPEAVGLTLADDGVNLPPEQLQRAFTPYFQGEKNMTFEVAGMGLGLPRVASLIWTVGGACRISNRPDRPGVVVDLIIPLAEDIPEY